MIDYNTAIYTARIFENFKNMGVQHLWSILEPSKTEENIENLRDKTLCIDLSLWICEAQGTKGLKDQLKPHLRNVFFRTLYLASLGVRPVFVIDGVPPEIKRETIVKRLQARGEHVTNVAQRKKLNRSKFIMRCNECCEMMGLLGIPFVRSDGEAEAMCAWLNENNYADGVLTDDGDVFLYGAKVVYKDFNISSSKHPKDNLQVFRLEKIESELGLNRRNMIALALLLGCDYLPAGVPGVGKETVVKLFTSLPGVDLLNRFNEWKSSPDAHPQNETSLELAIKRKAVKASDFPSIAVMKEFLSPKIGYRNINLRWKCPDLEGIKEFFFRKLDWPKEYTEEKMLVLGTDWQLAHLKHHQALLFSPTRIIKPRIKQGKEYYEIEWNTDDQNSGKYWPKMFVSVKPKEMILEKFPTLVERFEIELAAKKSKGKTKKGKKNKRTSDDREGVDQLLDMINKMELKENAKMPVLCSDDGNDENLFRNVSPNEARKSCCESCQDFENDDIEDDSVAGTTTNNNTRTYTNKKCFVDLKCATREEQTGIAVDKINQDQINKNASSISVISCSPPNCDLFVSDVLEIVDSFNSPNENENSLKNLADITVDQVFDCSELEAVDDLLTESFVADLQSVTPLHGCPCYSTEISPNSELLGDNYSKCDEILLESNNGENEDETSFKNEDIDFQRERNIKPVAIKRQDSWTAVDGLDDEDEEAKATCLVGDPDTPCSRNSISLASRLLKRFQTKDRALMADKLLSISSEGELATTK